MLRVIYIQYAWVVPLKDKKGITSINAFQKMLESCCQYNKSMKSWQEKNNIEMHLTYNEGKSIVAERFIRILKNKVYKYLTSIFKKMCIDKLDITSNNYNNIYHSTIKIKLVDVNSSAYIYFDKK